MIQQVLSLTPDQINGLPANERAAIMQLVRVVWPVAGSCGTQCLIVADTNFGNDVKPSHQTSDLLSPAKHHTCVSIDLVCRSWFR